MNVEEFGASEAEERAVGGAKTLGAPALQHLGDAVVNLRKMFANVVQQGDGKLGERTFAIQFDMGIALKGFIHLDRIIVQGIKNLKSDQSRAMAGGHGRLDSIRTGPGHFGSRKGDATG